MNIPECDKGRGCKYKDSLKECFKVRKSNYTVYKNDAFLAGCTGYEEKPEEPDLDKDINLDKPRFSCWLYR